jgi:hypothetical protein
MMRNFKIHAKNTKINKNIYELSMFGDGMMWRT